MPTTALTIQINDISGYLAANAVARGDLFSPFFNNDLPMILYMEGKALKFGSAYGASDIQAVANYVYSLDYNPNKAQRILSASTAGTVPSVNETSTSPNPLDFLVSASTTIPTGGFTVNLPQFIGYDVNFARNGVTQYTTNPSDGSTYFGWSKVTGEFTIYNGVAQVGEQFRIMPDAGGVSSSSSTSTIYDTITLSANGVYTLASGYMLYKIAIKPTAADTVRIGTTLNGEEIMMDKVMTPNVYGSNGANADVYADGAAVTIYFTGFTATATINIYLLPI